MDIKVNYVGQNTQPTPSEVPVSTIDTSMNDVPTPEPKSEVNPLSTIAIILLILLSVFLYFKSSPIQKAFDGVRKNYVEAYKLCERIAEIELDTTAKLDIIKANGADPMQNLKWKCTAVERYETIIGSWASSTGSLDELFDTWSNWF